MKSRDTRRKFGQNYLKDPAILIQMGGAINPKKSENILEIGPGLGALTNQINLEGVNIVGIDIDEENINYLIKKLLSQLIKNLLVIQSTSKKLQKAMAF